MPAREIHHIDLTVTDVDRSVAFYRELLEPLGLKEAARFPSYRGTEEVIYYTFGASEYGFGLRPADGGEYTYYAPGVEHIAFRVDTRKEVEDAHRRAVDMGAKVHFPPEDDKDVEGYYAVFVFDPDGIRIEVFSDEGLDPT